MENRFQPFGDHYGGHYLTPKLVSGWANYVLRDSKGRALAVIEAKKNAINPYVAKQQALPYAQLYTACSLHTQAKTHVNITVQTCFDADRLDLARVGKIPDPKFLCTEAAKDPKTIE